MYVSHYSIPSPSLALHQYLYQGANTDNMPAILCAKAHGGDMNFVNGDDEGKSPMLVAVEQVCRCTCMPLMSKTSTYIPCNLY